MTRSSLSGKTDDDAAGFLLHRLSGLVHLTPDEVEQVRALRSGRRQYQARSELYAEGKACPARFILSGWGARQRILSDGRRQIVSLLLPGGLIGPTLHPRLSSVCAGIALTTMETVDVRPLADHAVAGGKSGLAHAFHLLERLDELALRNQVVRLGRQTAYERALHLLLELRARLAVTDPEITDRYAMPLTQEMLADVLGLTVVHVNRTLQQARREGLIELQGGVVTLRQIPMIEAITDWQPFPAPAE